MAPRGTGPARLSSRGLTLPCADPDGEGASAGSPLRRPGATPTGRFCRTVSPASRPEGRGVRGAPGALHARLLLGAPPSQKGRRESGKKWGRASLLGLPSPGVRWVLSWPRTVTGPEVTSSAEAQKHQRRAHFEACGATSACSA